MPWLEEISYLIWLHLWKVQGMVKIPYNTLLFKLSAFIKFTTLPVHYLNFVSRINLFHIILSKELFSLWGIKESIQEIELKASISNTRKIKSYLFPVSDEVKSSYFLKMQCYILQFIYWDLFHILKIPTCIRKLKYFKLITWMKANV